MVKYGKISLFVFAFLSNLAVFGQPLPAYASVSDHVVLGSGAIVKMQNVETGLGYSRFLVVSNSPFKIYARDVIGDVNVSVRQSGVLNGNTYGKNSQLPGKLKSCSNVSTFLESEIYFGERKTAVKPGSLTEQSVEIIVRYSEDANPIISAFPSTPGNINSYRTASSCGSMAQTAGKAGYTDD